MQADNPLQASRQGSILTFFVVHYDGIVRMLVGGLGVGLRLALRRQLFMYIYIYIYTHFVLLIYTCIHVIGLRLALRWLDQYTLYTIYVSYTCSRSTPRSAAAWRRCSPSPRASRTSRQICIYIYIYIYIYICFTYYILHITYIYIYIERERDRYRYIQYIIIYYNTS